MRQINAHDNLIISRLFYLHKLKQILTNENLKIK
jgi:hypothetical protein